MLRARSTFFFLVAAASFARALVPDWAPPLSTRGRYVVDANGNRFKLKSGNWHGASGTWEGSGDINDDGTQHAGENGHFMALGLQYVAIDKIIDSFEEIGVNSIRLPFASEITTDTQIVKDEWVAANPQLRGKTPLEVYDEIVKALTDRRMAVVLNNHTNKYRWCCSNDGNERWNASQDEEAWVQAWLFMVNRYKDNKRVAAADLYNEVRRSILDDPNWGLWDSHDWFRAADNAANRILQANRDIVIIIEGINWYGIPVDGFPHGRPGLSPVRGLSHTLLSSDKLVYSAHFYSYTGSHHSGASGLGETTDPRYRDLSLDDLKATYHDEATYVATDSDAHYVHPVWISEFGIGRLGTGGDDADSNWFRNTVNHWRDLDVDFAYWPLVGYLENGNGNGWALQNWNKAGERDGLTDGKDWRKDIWMSLVNNTNEKTGPIDKVPVWRMLNLDHADDVKSYGLIGNDWDNGARKATCPDGTRLIGVSRSSRGLCTDAGAPGSRTWSSTETVWDEKYVDGDWAGGFTKYTCPAGSYMIGWAVRGAKVSTVLCGLSNEPLGAGEKRTLWFDQGDNRGDNPLGGDFSSGQNKGQCQPDEHIGGIAFSTSLFRQGNPAAILCRK